MEDFWAPEIRTFDKIYRHLVQVYSMRQLSFKGDFLNAFLRISNCLEVSSGIKFLWDFQPTFWQEDWPGIDQAI